MQQADRETHDAVMETRIDVLELATEIAEIAGTTTDRKAARRLLDLADRLLSEAGLPPLTGEGGGDPPPGPVHAMLLTLPEFA